MQQGTSSSQFVLWKVRLEQEVNEFRTMDWYLAQIAREIRAQRLKRPDRLKIEDMLIKFGVKGKAPAMKAEDRLALSKAYWRAVAGMPGRKPPKMKKKV